MFETRPARPSLFLYPLKQLGNCRTNSSIAFGSKAKDLEVTKWLLWHAHFTVRRWGISSMSFVVTELWFPNITKQVSAEKPTICCLGMSALSSWVNNALFRPSAEASLTRFNLIILEWSLPSQWDTTIVILFLVDTSPLNDTKKIYIRIKLFKLIHNTWSE